MVNTARLTALIAVWRTRCKKLAEEGKYWEAGRLNEAANELQAIVTDAQVLTTDQQVRDAYEKARQTQPYYPPTSWPNQQPNVFNPVPGLSPQTRVVD